MKSYDKVISRIQRRLRPASVCSMWWWWWLTVTCADHTARTRWLPWSSSACHVCHTF